MKEHTEYLELISRFVDSDTLTAEERTSLEHHLTDCRECREFLDFCKDLQKVDLETKAPEGFTQAVMAAIPRKRRGITFYLSRTAAGLAACLVLFLGVRVFTDHFQKNAADSAGIAANGAMSYHDTDAAGGYAIAVVPETAYDESVIEDVAEEETISETPAESFANNAVVAPAKGEHTDVLTAAEAEPSFSDDMPSSAAVTEKRDSENSVTDFDRLAAALLVGRLHISDDFSLSFEPDDALYPPAAVEYRLDPASPELEPGDYRGEFVLTDSWQEEDLLVLQILPRTVTPETP